MGLESVYLLGKLSNKYTVYWLLKKLAESGAGEYVLAGQTDQHIYSLLIIKEAGIMWGRSVLSSWWVKKQIFFLQS